MAFLSRTFFALVLCLACTAALAKHSMQVSYVYLPELTTRLTKILDRHGYKISPLSQSGKMADVMITFNGEATHPTPEFLTDLFFHNFVESMKPIYPLENRTSLQIRVAENLDRAELNALFSDLQYNGAWIEHARLLPPFNFTINFDSAKHEEMLKLLQKYDYIDQYHSDPIENPQTHFLNDGKRRGVSTFTMRMMLPRMVPMILETIPADALALCVYEVDESEEFDRISFTCPNDFSVLTKIFESVNAYETQQALRISIEGEYLDYIARRNNSHIYDGEDYKRLVLEPRRESAIEMAKNSSEYKALKENTKADELSMKTYHLGMRLLRELVSSLGYDVFKLLARHDDEGSPIQQIFIELPQEGISAEDFNKLLVNFSIYPYLDNGRADHKNELKDSKSESCEFFLSPSK